MAGAPTVNPAQVGTKCAAWYRLTVGPGETQVVRVRLRPPSSSPAFGTPFDTVLAQRRSEADEFYAEVIPASVDEDARLVARQAFAGMIWGKQFYRYDVKRWLDGDPTQPPPPPERRRGRNAGWLNLDARDILSMPDPWEYPWFAAWDMAFHTIALAHLDPAFAKYQLLALCREWFQNPNGALPAYEWAFGDVNPPVHAWAALHVWDIDGRRDHDFLARLMPKLLMNFTWWVNQMDPEGDHLFAGGFLGLDNISALDRSNLPPGGRLEQADGTSWMAFYSLVHAGDRPGAGREGRRLDRHRGEVHRALRADRRRHAHPGALGRAGRLLLRRVPRSRRRRGPDQGPVDRRACCRCSARSSWAPTSSELLGNLRKRFAGFLGYDELGVPGGGRGRVATVPDGDALAVGVIPRGAARRVLARVFDEDEFLSPHGLRALSKYHEAHPLSVELAGTVVSVDYEPAESRTGMFGGNSNWRGPVWMPVNYLVVRSLQRYARSLGASAEIEYPTGSGQPVVLATCADDLRRRLVSLFLRGPDGRRPCHGWVEQAAGRPAVAGQRDVQRVLPR